MNDPAVPAARDETLAVAVANVRARIARAARRAGRDPAEVRLVAAAKTVPVERVASLVASGVTDVGENRAQELRAKAKVLGGQPTGETSTGSPRWHFIGRLQRNKVRMVAPWVAWWQSVDRVDLGAEIARRAPGARVLVEVNAAGEPQKGGCTPGETAELVDTLRDLGLVVDGLMTIPPGASPLAADPVDDPRRSFAALRELGAALRVPELSMGMSDDFELAIGEGATIVRVGRALFGARDPATGMDDRHPPGAKQ